MGAMSCLGGGLRSQSAFLVYVMKSIPRHMLLNERPDGQIHRIEFWRVRWPHVWRYEIGVVRHIAVQLCHNVCMQTRVHFH